MVKCWIKEDIARLIKTREIDKKRFFETYDYDVREDIENAFVRGGSRRGIHRVSAKASYNSDLKLVEFDMQLQASAWYWYQKLAQIIPNPDDQFWVIFENWRYWGRYWIYEGYMPELVIILNEVSRADFYLVSKNLDWLIAERAVDNVVQFVGENICTDIFQTIIEGE